MALHKHTPAQRKAILSKKSSGSKKTVSKKSSSKSSGKKSRY